METVMAELHVSIGTLSTEVNAASDKVVALASHSESEAFSFTAVTTLPAPYVEQGAAAPAVVSSSSDDSRRAAELAEEVSIQSSPTASRAVDLQLARDEAATSSASLAALNAQFDELKTELSASTSANDELEAAAATLTASRCDLPARLRA